MGDVETGTCGCGRTGQIINFRRRGPGGGGSDHCPVSIERYLGSGTTAEAEAPALLKAVSW
jgi:long-chain-fatty-acid---luciferin-component ligase